MRFDPPDAYGLNWKPVLMSVWNAHPDIYPTTIGDGNGALGNGAILSRFAGDQFANSIVVDNPTSRDWYYNANAPGNHWTALYLPFIQKQYPQGWDSTRGGLRIQKMAGGATFTFSYFHTQNYNPTLVREDVLTRPSPLTAGMLHISTLPPSLILGFSSPGYRQYTFKFPNVDIFGAALNHVFEHVPGVLRAEAIYIPDQVFASRSVKDQDGMTRRDYVKYMVGYDLNGYFYFPWHKDDAFNITVEHVGEWIPQNTNVQYITYDTEYKQYNPSFSVLIGTTWFYKLLSTSLLAVYMPWADSGFISPSVGFTPSWMNGKWSFTLMYVNCYGQSDTKGFVFARDKNLLVLTSEFDF